MKADGNRMITLLFHLEYEFQLSTEAKAFAKRHGAEWPDLTVTHHCEALRKQIVHYEKLGWAE